MFRLCIKGKTGRSFACAQDDGGLVILRRSRRISLYLPLFVIQACTFNFELTTQRTALENQILGTYGEVDEEVVLASSIKNKAKDTATAETSAVTATVARVESKLARARKNQEFNRDDVEELKNDQVLGEANDGTLVILSKDIGLVKQADPEKMQLGKLLVYEENKDREQIWQALALQIQDEGENSLEKVKREFIKSQRVSAKIGHWLQNEGGEWKQKLE